MPFEGEQRVLVPSPKVATYDLQPAMSSAEVANEVVRAVSADMYGFVMCNFAPPDMVGHTGRLPEAIQAVEATDKAIGAVWQACKAHGYTLVVTADHGNAEKMIDPATGTPHKAHTCAKVPLIIIRPGLEPVRLPRDPALCDVAPTLLALMGLQPPPEMTGAVLYRL